MPTIPSGEQGSPYTITAAGTYTLNVGEVRKQTAGTGVAVTATAGMVTVDIQGTLNNVAMGQRAINFANNPMTGAIIVGANGAVQSLNQDTIRNQSVNGRIDLTNLGQIVSGSTAFTPTPGGTNPGTGYAITYNAARGATGATASDYTSGGVLTNGSTSNTTALIRSDTGDAIRLGSHTTLVNYGSIIANGPVNDSSANNAFNSTTSGGNGNPNTSIAETYDSSRGVRFNQDLQTSKNPATNGTAGKVENYGRIEGSQHGVDVGQTTITNIVVNNYAGGDIVGDNGSGVGADTAGAAATTVTVANSGTITGAYAPQFDRAGYETTDGDGDGVDVDGGATVVNNAGAVIEGTGAGGFDSNGRANNSEGISIGGGVVTNSGTIRGAAYGIVVNNDSNANNSRSGVSATVVTNNATGTIQGQAGYAIRLENKTGTAADNDVIVNYGVITGTGGVPTGTVNRQDGTADAGTVGTLDGVAYTAANAGSARFIRGDGSAVQTGEGADTVSNYGTLTAVASGRALNLEGGSDTLNLYTGATVTGRLDGGSDIGDADNDVLNLRLDDRTGTVAGAGTNSGATMGTLGATVNFETLDVQSGAWTVGQSQGFRQGASITAGAILTLAPAVTLTAPAAVSGTLRGTGNVAGAVVVASGGVIEAGIGANGTGTLATGNLTLAAGASLAADLAGTGAGAYDRQAVTGTVDLGGADLVLDFAPNYATARGDSFTLIANDGVDAVTGRFARLSLNGGASATIDASDTFTYAGHTFQISYAADADGSGAAGGVRGNDVTLTDVTVPTNSSGGGDTAPPAQTPMLEPGTNGPDNLAGGDGPDTLLGAAGDDTVMGLGGDDLIQGNQGNDLLLGNQGRDTLFGGQGQDVVFGGQDSDVLLGNLGADILFGNMGADTLYGGQDADTLYGGQGDDALFGDLGDDVLSGDLGNDALIGGAGADRYVFGVNTGADAVIGFSQAEGDRLDIGGQTYTFGTAADGSGSALLLLSGGGTIELAGISQGQVNQSYFA